MKWWPALVALTACAHAPVAKPAGPTVAGLRVAWPDGCLAAAVDGEVFETDARACAEPRRPYATFELASALIGVDTGALADDTAATADAAQVTLALGEARMANGLAMLRYGNRSIAGGLDRFWLGGGLRITGRKQLAFVDGLAHGTLSATGPAQAVVRRVSAVARADDGAVLHGKPGAGAIEDEPGWLVWEVGWVERRDGSIVAYAGWLERRGGTLDAARAVGADRLASALRQLGLFTPSARAGRP